MPQKGGNNNSNDSSCADFDPIRQHDSRGTCWMNALLMCVLYSRNIIAQLSIKLYHEKLISITKDLDKANIILSRCIYFGANDRNVKEMCSMELPGFPTLRNRKNLQEFADKLTNQKLFYQMLLSITKPKGVQERFDKIDACLDPTFIMNVLQNMNPKNYGLAKQTRYGKEGFSSYIYIYHFLHAAGLNHNEVLYIAGHEPKTSCIHMHQISFENNGELLRDEPLRQVQRTPINDTKIVLLSLGYFKMFEYFHKTPLGIVEGYDGNVPMELTIEGKVFKLQSMIISSFAHVAKKDRQKQPHGHAIAGIICNNRRKLYNGWGMKENGKACDLFDFDWVLDNKSFTLKDAECGFEYINDAIFQQNAIMNNGRLNNTPSSTLPPTFVYKRETEEGILGFNASRGSRLFVYVAR